MSLAALLSETATAISYTDSTDEYGNTVPAGEETRTDYPARFEQLSTDETIRDRDTVLVDWRVFLPPDAAITPYHRIEGRGHLFEVVGLPNVHHTPRGPHHLEVHLRWVV